MDFLRMIQGAKFAKSIVPQSVTDTDTNGTGVDCRGFRSACFVFHAGAIGAADFADLHLEESSDDSSYSTVTASDFTGYYPTQTDDNKFWLVFVDLRKYKRYLRWNADPGNAATLMTGLAILGDALEMPNSDTERGVAKSLSAT